MSVSYAILVAIGICVAAAALEGMCAGKNVKPFFAQLTFPPYSAPLWVWSIIGGLYYLIFSFIIYRLLILGYDSRLKYATLALILLMMVVNAMTNYIIFRARNLRLSFIIGNIFPLLDITLFVCLLQLDNVVALSLIPYLIYRGYAIWWGYALWKANVQAA